MKYSFLALLIFLLASALPVTEVQAQDPNEDPYSDYSHLWEEAPKKKKEKKKKQNKESNTLEPVTDSPIVTSPDTLEVSEEPSTEVTEVIEEPVSAVEGEVEEVPEEPKEKARKEKPVSDGPEIQDFRAPLPSSGGNGSFTGGFTYTQIGNEDFVGLVLSPEFKLGKVGVGLNVPILYGLDSKSVRTEIFKDGVGAARLIRYIRYGTQKVDPVYVKVGQLEGTMIGYGGLINNYTNTTSFEKRKLGLHYDINYKGLGGIEGLYSDFDPASFNLFAIRPYVRPLSKSGIPVVKTFELGAVVISDKDQTSIPTSDSTSTTYTFTGSGISAFGIDMGVTLLRVPFIQIDFFANYSKLDVESDTLTQVANVVLGDNSFSSGSGFSAGLNFRMHFIADVMSTDIRIERLTYQDHFLPQFFDASYEINKDARILSLITAQKMSGIYGSLTGHVLQKVELGGSLLIPDEISDTSPAVVQVRANIERLADKYSLRASYIKGNLTDLGDAFKLDERSLAKVRFIYHMNSFLAMGVDYYWAFAPREDGSFQASKYVMPYFGLSIDF